MGKASKWFKALLGFKKNESSISSTNKKKWGDVKSYKDKDFQQHHEKSHYMNSRAGVDLAIYEVHSSLTTSSVIRTTTWNSEEWAAVVIQSYFRAYLSRRALRALKGLVKLQALVRGHIVRKQAADMLRRMQALIRAQSRARLGRSMVFESPPFSTKSTQSIHHGPTTSSRCTRSRTGPFTPTKSSTRSYTSDEYSNNHPNYMSYTEAAKAKTRSMSAPRLRSQYDKKYARSNMQ
ncbi:protein IQ-DOMAIN 24 [Solanum lycopersicum]|uniref:DUF4005 domain-containing protein n=1 Tax=Solanum lycopersicum TaxID=4081 RepID=A0A3Q7HKT6_SOLLC|nr:protein IQ-DOMAIN 31-like [Solanum lycopersicum]